VTSERRSLPGPNELVDAWVKSAAEAERHWNEFFNQIMGTEAFAQMMARSTESYATAQEAFARGMEQYLHAMNMPTRADLAQLAERVTALEQRMDALTSLMPANAAEGSRPAEKRRSGGGRRKQTA
jgi:polyhydroxyalkanoate synthesis regulator phasin